MDNLSWKKQDHKPFVDMSRYIKNKKALQPMRTWNGCRACSSQEQDIPGDVS